MTFVEALSYAEAFGDLEHSTASLSASAQASWWSSIRLASDLRLRSLRPDSASHCISLDAMAKTSWQEALSYLQLIHSDGLKVTSATNIVCNCMGWQMALLMEPSEEMALNAIISHEDMQISLATELLEHYQEPISALWALARLTFRDPVEIHSVALRARSAWMKLQVGYSKMSWATAALGIEWRPEFWSLEQLSGLI